MGATARVPWQLEIVFTCLLFCSGPCISEKPPSYVSAIKKIAIDVEKRILLLSSVSPVQLDDVPVVNPITPGSANPSPSAQTTPQGSFTTVPNPTYSAPQAPTTPQGPFTTGPNPTNSAPLTPNQNMPTTMTPSSSGGSWCIASPAASPTALQVALDYACGYGGADCSAIQSGGSCYEPNTVRDHASYAFNDFYQKHPSPTSCSFGGVAKVANTDPSQGKCHFASSTTQSTTPPAVQSPPDLGMPAAPVTPTTPNMSMPGGQSGFGLEPTGSISPSTSISYSISLIVFTKIILLDSMVVESKRR